MSRAQIRMKQELQMLSNDPRPGIFCYSVDNKTTHLKAGTFYICICSTPHID